MYGNIEEYPLHSMHIIGFHHKQGSILEFTYPEGKNCELISYLALPDCVHNETAETFFFTLNLQGSTKHCVSCFRQVPNDHVTVEMNRNFVQKAVVIVSNIPFYGLIASYMQGPTKAYFDQKDFSNTSILSETFELINKSLTQVSLSELYLGFSTRMLLHLFKEKVFMIFKLILLQGRIIVFSKKSSQVSSIIYALLSLYPGQLCFDSLDYFPDYKAHLQMLGLPLKIFNDDYVLHSYISVFQLSEMEKSAYLVGCTNLMITEHPRSKPHAVVNIDTGKIKFTLPGKMMDWVKLNSAESKFIKDRCNGVESSWNSRETWEVSENEIWNRSHYNIINDFHNFFKGKLCSLAFARLRMQGQKIETLMEKPKKSSKKFKYYNLDPEEKKVSKYKKFTKGLKSSFIAKWTNSENFKLWIQNHNPNSAHLSEHCGQVTSDGIFYENGDIYKGGLCGGKRNGIGILTNKDWSYEGEWKNDVKSGKGTLTKNDGSYIYEGEWDGDAQNGEGSEIKGREKYFGSFVNGKYHGNGIYIDNDLNQYDGEWVHGLRK